MPVVNCPYPECTYATGDVSDTLAATMLTIHASGAHTSNPPTQTARTADATGKTERFRRPVIATAGTSEDWSYFTARWTEYKAATRITGRDIVLQLLECCEDELRKDLIRTAGRSLANETEQSVLTAIKLLAVREENTMVARLELFNMVQNHDERIRSYGARLRGQANVCKYTKTCTKADCDEEINYMDDMIREALIRGIADTEIQLDLLQDKNQNMSLEEVFQFIEAKEAGKRSASKLATNVYVSSSRSQYQREKRELNKSTSSNTKPDDIDKRAPCNYCGKIGHGSRAPPEMRKKLCPAYDTTCTFCNRPHHDEQNCRTKKKSNGAGGTQASSVSEFQSLCGISTHPSSTRESITLDHHKYVELNNQWVRQKSKVQPFIQLGASIDPSDYAAFGFKLPGKTRLSESTIPVMADTGCQSCLAGIKTIKKFGLSKEELIPVSMQMHAANDNGIHILGAIIMTFSGKSPAGKTLSTKQIVYITDNSDKVFLSREACTDLGIISNNFPTIGETQELIDSSCLLTAQEEMEHSPTVEDCDCPRKREPPPKPTTLPYPATDENREKTQAYLLDYYAESTFNTCEHTPSETMVGPYMRLMIEQEGTPKVHHKPIPVPLHLQDDVKTQLDNDVRLGCLEVVPVGEPVTWCHQMIIGTRKNGKPRRTVDFQALNTYATRETHHTQSPFHQARSIPHNKKKTVFDCWNGYHSIPLHPDDRHYTTFITPWGRYRYLRGPQGYIATGDAFTRRFDEIVSDIPNHTKCIDDTCMWADNLEESFFQAVEWLDTCGRNGITLNPEKFVFGADNVEFAGFEITPNSVRPCRRYLNAVLDFPTPRNITDVRSWFGLLQQVSYAFSIAEHTAPFRHLLQPKTPFHWTEEHTTLFETTKQVIVSEIEEGVQIFDKSKTTCLATDWSKDGIGFWLFQKHCKCEIKTLQCCTTGWKIALVGSRFTHPAESRYAPVEGEALAVAYALDKARFFVMGCTDLIIAVDHLPLLRIFSDRSLDVPNARLRNLKERTLRYRFTMEHVPGAKHKAADALSRYPSGSTIPSRLHLPEDVASIEDQPINIKRNFLAGIRCSDTQPPDVDHDILVGAISAMESLQAGSWDETRVATNSDADMLQLLAIIESGFPPSRNDLPLSLRHYYQFRDNLYSVDGVVMYKDRIVVPPSLRPKMLDILHSAHQAVTAMTARAESTIFWPGITPAIAIKRDQCDDCNRNAKSQPSAPPQIMFTPTYPFQCVCSDFFKYKGYYYFVVVDRYSNWPIVERAAEGSKGLIDCLRRTFATFGIPDELASDGGPEYKAKATNDFLKSWNVYHRTSSVANPHSNARAEIGVKTSKRLLMSNTGPKGELDVNAFQIAMLQYRNTPDPATKLSPAMCIFGRPVKDFIPILPGRYQPHPTWRDTLSAREEALRNRHMQAAERWSEHTRRLPPLVVGDFVRIQNQVGPHPTKWDKTGTIVEVRQFDQYVVRVDGSGRATLRNRKFLRKYIPFKARQPQTTTLEDLRYASRPFPHASQQVHGEEHTQNKLTPNTNILQTSPNTQRETPTVAVRNTPPNMNTPPVVLPASENLVPPAMEPQGNDRTDADVPVIQSSQSTAPPPPPVAPTKKKVPLALRRLASHNKDGPIGY